MISDWSCFSYQWTPFTSDVIVHINNDDIDVVRGKIFKLCEAMGGDVYSTMEQIHETNSKQD